MMKQKRFFLCLVGIFTLLAVLLRTVLLFTSFRVSAQHYTTAVPEYWLWGFWFLAVLCIFLFLMFFRRKEELLTIAAFHQRPVMIAAICLSLVAILTGAYGCISAILWQISGMEAFFAVTGSLFVLVFGGIFGYLALKETERYTPVICIAPVAYIVYAMYLYFDSTHFMNNPNTLLSRLAFILFALYFLQEIRVAMGRNSGLLLPLLGAVSALTGAYAALPSLLYGAATGKTLTTGVIPDLFLLLSAGYVGLRLFLPTTTTTETV